MRRTLAVAATLLLGAVLALWFAIDRGATNAHRESIESRESPSEAPRPLSSTPPSPTSPRSPPLARIRSLPEQESRLRSHLSPFLGDAALIESITCTPDSCRVVLIASDPQSFTPVWEHLQDPDSGLSEFGDTLLLEAPDPPRFSFRLGTGSRLTE